MDRTYRKFMELLIHRPKYGVWFLAFSGLLLAGALSMVFFKSVIFKTLPFDNKNEFQVVINMPESSSLENTLKAAREMGDYLSSVGEVENTQIYAGAQMGGGQRQGGGQAPMMGMMSGGAAMVVYDKYI